MNDAQNAQSQYRQGDQVYRLKDSRHGAVVAVCSVTGTPDYRVVCDFHDGGFWVTDKPAVSLRNESDIAERSDAAKKGWETRRKKKP